jgi:uncharacterized protein YgbK (DUF1537 family)
VLCRASAKLISLLAAQAGVLSLKVRTADYDAAVAERDTVLKTLTARDRKKMFKVCSSLRHFCQ